MSRLVILLTLLASPAASLRVGEDRSDATQTVNATASEQLCCVWRVELGKMNCERDIYSHSGRACKPGTEKWDLSAAREVCTNLKQGNQYMLANSLGASYYLESKWSLKTNCVCEKYKGPYKGGGMAKKYPNGISTCQSTGALGGTHCKLNGQPVRSCMCAPAQMTCSDEDMSVLFAPQVKKKGMMFNCGGWFDKNTGSGHYLEAFQALGMVSDDAKPVQKMIGSDEGTPGWTFRDKYGGQDLASSGFCGAEVEIPEMPAAE